MNNLTSNAFKSFIIIFIVWIFVQAGNYMFLGMRHGGDSGMYVQGAYDVMAGRKFQGRVALSKSYVYLLASVYGLGGGLTTVVIIQCLMALLGAWLLFIIGTMSFGLNVGFLASLLYLINFDIQRWNFYLLTETSATVLLIAVISMVILYKKRPMWGVGLITTGFLFFFCRPEAKYLLLPIIVVFILFMRRKRMDLIVGGIILLALIVVHSTTLRYFDNIAINDSYNGVIVWGYNQTIIPAPEGVMSLQKDKGYLYFFISSLMSYPGWQLKLLAYRAFYFLSHTRPFYSLLHNTIALVTMLTIYVLAIIGTIANKKLWKISLLIWSIFIFQCVMCCWITLDWDCRFIGRVTPLLTLLAAAGIAVIWQATYTKVHKLLFRE